MVQIKRCFYGLDVCIYISHFTKYSNISLLFENPSLNLPGKRHWYVTEVEGFPEEAFVQRYAIDQANRFVKDLIYFSNGIKDKSGVVELMNRMAEAIAKDYADSPADSDFKRGFDTGVDLAWKIIHDIVDEEPKDVY
jgi:hypothetical protein